MSVKTVALATVFVFGAGLLALYAAWQLDESKKLVRTNVVEQSEEDGTLVVLTLLEQLESVRRGMEELGYTVESAELTRVPKTMSEPDTDKATQSMQLIERVEDLDDVQKVYTNLELTEEVMAASAG